MLVNDVVAQPGGRGGRGGRGGQARGGLQTLLMREDVRRELEITDDQMEELRELGRGGGGERVDREKLREELEGLSDEERREKMREMRQKRTDGAKAKIGEVLLPQQMQRLEQLVTQFSVRAGGQAMFRGALAEKLEITDEQREKLEKKLKNCKRSTTSKCQKLRRDMQEKLLDGLSAEQRKKYRELMGESFEFEQTDRRGGRGGGEGRRGRGERGGRGGRGGGRLTFSQSPKITSFAITAMRYRMAFFIDILIRLPQAVTIVLCI